MTLKRIIPCLLLVLLATSAFSADGQPRYLEMTFLTTNDLHANVTPFTRRADPKNNRPAVPDIGGMARIATVVRQTRDEMRAPVLLLDSGDTTHGYTALVKAFHGESVIAVMNAVGYDAMVPGNHDLQWHSPDTVRNLESSEFPWVCANLVDAETGELFVEPYVIRELWGVRVALFGLTNGLINTHPHVYVAGPELGLKVLPAAELVPELRRKADVVVLLSHLGLGLDTQLAKAVPGIDIILGGHSHSTLRTPRLVPVGEPTASYLGAVPVVQAGAWGDKMGRTRAIFRRDDDDRYTLMSCTGELVSIDSSIPDDPEILGIIQEFQARIPPPKPNPAAQ